MKSKRILFISIGALLAIALTFTLLAYQFRHQLYQAGIDAETKSLGLHTKTVQAGNITWSYLENDRRGEKPTLVLVHGFSASKETWLATSQYLANDFHLVMPDLPGHGDSTFDSNHKYNLAGLAEQFGAFVDAIGLQQFALIGNSMGGGIAGFYAGTHPDRLTSVFLLDPAGIIDYRSDYQQRVDRGENPLLVESVADLDFLFEYAVANKITIPWPFNQVLVDRAIAKRPMLDKIFADLIADPNDNIKAQVKQITAPTLLLWGKQDRLIAPENASLYQQLNPAIQVKLLDQVGHIPQVEIPEACADMVLKFVAEALRQSH